MPAANPTSTRGGARHMRPRSRKSSLPKPGKVDGAAVLGVALLLTGYIIHDIGLKNVRLDRDLGIAMIFRFLLAPTLSVALCRAFGVTGLAHDVLIVETAMPVVTQTVVAAAEYGADEQLAAQGAAISTLACFVVTPVLMLLL